jgi:CheY-like chemotaxis protein
VLLPKIQEAVKETSGQKHHVAGDTERILFIEDEELLLDWGQSVLKKLGYDVTALSDPQQALVTFSLHPMRFDCIVTDHAMPHISSAQLTAKFLKIKKDIPIILCTWQAEKFHQSTSTNINFGFIHPIYHEFSV